MTHVHDINWGNYQFFEAREFTHPNKMDPRLLRKLDNARAFAGIAFVITSSFRPESTTSHGRGTGVDIRCHDSLSRFRIVEALLHEKFTRIGIYDKHIHADIDSSEDAPQEVIWWGTSA